MPVYFWSAGRGSFACMYFQDSSLLQFQRLVEEKEGRNNLRNLFGVENIPKDSQLRDILDRISSTELAPIFNDFYERLRRHKHLENYAIFPNTLLCGALCVHLFRVNRSKVDAMKKVAKMIGSHLEGIVTWVRTRITNGFLEALNGIFQAAKRKARGFRSLRTIRTVVFMLAGKLDFSQLNPHIQRVPT